MSHKKIARPEYVYENLERLPEQLKEGGLSQIGVEEQIGLAKRSLTKWICGASLPKKANYNRLAEFFGWEVWQ